MIELPCAIVLAHRWFYKLIKQIYLLRSFPCAGYVLISNGAIMCM